MAKSVIKLGITDRSVFVLIPDPASTDGSGKTGLVAANLTVSYARMETDNDATVTDVTSSLNNLAALTTAHTDWGVLEVSSTLAPGLYRLDIADAVFASGAWDAVVYVMITTSAAAASPMEFQLVAYDPLDTVRLGLTALPNAAADAAGGLPISDAGGLDMDSIKSDTAAILVDTGTTLDGRIPAALVGGRMDSSVGAVAAGAITAAAIADGAIDAATFAAGAIDAAAVATGAIDADALAADAVTEIWAKAMAELTGPPAATGTVLQALTFLLMSLRNARATTATADVITNDAGATIATAVLSDNGVTFSKGEYA